jgi:colanic acid/amylovoran biosynthesis glycosyltransferase
MSPLRIGYVVGSFPKLSETFIAGEIAELVRRGIEVRICALRPGETPHHEIVGRARLLDRTIHAPGDFSAVLREFAPDLLHAHFMTRPAAVARELAQELKVPFTVTAHRYDIYDKAPADFADRARAASGLVTVSRANTHYIQATFGVPATHIHVIPCGIDTDRFRPGERRASPPHLVCVARLKPFKNQHLLLEASVQLRERGVEFRCVLVGEGPCRQELEDRCAELGLEDRVTFAGAATQREVLGWWQRATVAVLPSQSEGMPVCLMEAAACGIPAVATAVGGVPELIQDGVTGLLVPPGDSRALADGIERLLTDPLTAGRMGRAARDRAQQQFTIERQVDRLLAVWANVVPAWMPA